MPPKKSWAKAAKFTAPQISATMSAQGSRSSVSNGNGQWAVKHISTQTITGDEDWDTSKPKAPPKTEEELTEEVVEQEKAAKKAAIDEKLAGWPWDGVPKKLVTAGPLYLNTWHTVLTQEMHEQKHCALMRAMDITGVREMIIDLLFPHHSSIWQLAFTCQKAQDIVKVTLDFWDLNICHFNGCEREPTTQATEDGKGLVAANLVISPLRSPTTVHLREANTLYEGQLYSTYLLCNTVKYRAENFRRIHLHRVPFLTVGLLSILIPAMTNLEALGIYKCPLIHIGNGMDLLAIIRCDRPKGKEYQVSLDWYPNYHIGPDPEVSGHDFMTGAYGATWDNWQGDTDRAIWALVVLFLQQCKLQGIDAISPHTQFRRWLEASPCWDVENTLAAITDVFGLNKITVGSKQGDFELWTPDTHHVNGRSVGPMAASDYLQKYPKLTKAVVLIDQRSPCHNGDIVKFFTVNTQTEYSRPEGFEWYFKRYPCMVCENSLHGVFFQYKDIRDYNEATSNGEDRNAYHDNICLGCRLTRYLDTEKDHYKKAKRTIDALWRYDHVTPEGEEIYNTTDLSKLIEDFDTRVMPKFAFDLDKHRAAQREQLGFDREYQERQVPVAAQVQRSRRGSFLSAPRVGEWAEKLRHREMIKKNPELAPYLGGQRTSYLIHGRHYG